MSRDIPTYGDYLLNKPGHASYLRKGTHNEIARQVAQQATSGGVQTSVEERDIP